MKTRINNVPYIKQTHTGGLWSASAKKFVKTDIPEREIKYGKKIKNVGCGQCCVAMALNYCLGKWFDPEKFSDRLSASGGSYHNIGAYEAGKLGIETEYTTDIDKAVDAIYKGHAVMSIQGKGLFTKTGHYILLIGLKDDKICVNDPASMLRTYTTSGKTWTRAQVDYAAKKSDGMAYTIFKKKQFEVNVKDRIYIWEAPKKIKKLGYLNNGQKVDVIDDTIRTWQGIEFVKVRKTKGVKDPKANYPIIGYMDRSYLI